jgi:hypothetical protein
LRGEAQDERKHGRRQQVAQADARPPCCDFLDDRSANLVRPV